MCRKYFDKYSHLKHYWSEVCIKVSIFILIMKHVEKIGYQLLAMYVVIKLCKALYFIADIAPVPIKKEDVRMVESNFSIIQYWPWEIPTATWKEVLNVCSKTTYTLFKN